MIEQDSHTVAIEDIVKRRDQVLAYTRELDSEQDVVTCVSEHYPHIHGAKSDAESIAHLDAVIAELCASVKSVDAALATTSTTLQRAASQLRRSRNALVKINTLPTEILCAIFAQFAGSSIVEKDRIATTCSRWREVCLAFPQFWAEFSVSKSRAPAVGRTISRARGVPLSITLNISAVANDTLDDLLSRLNKITTVRSLSLLSSDPAEFLWRWRVSLTALRTLRLEYLPPGGGFASSHEIHLLCSSEAGLQPVESLALVNCRWVYDPNIYQGLKSLYIRCDALQNSELTYLPEFRGPTQHTLVSALSGSPDLEDLALDNPHMDISEVLGMIDRPQRPVPLLRLRSLRANMALQKVSRLLAGLATSSDALQTVVLNLQNWGITQRSFICRVNKKTLLSLPSGESLPMLTRLRSLSVCYARRVIGGFSDVLPTSRELELLSGNENVSWRPTGLHIQFDCSGRDACLMIEAFNNLLESIARHYPLECLRTLRLELFLSIPKILTVLRAAPSLRSLTLDSCGSLIQILNAISDARERSNERFLPDLDSVTLVKGYLYPSEMPSLQRAVTRLGIRSLSFQECSSTLGRTEIVELLQAEGLEVRWIEDIVDK